MQNATPAPEMAWWGILGPLPHHEPSGWITTPHDRTRVLDGPYKIGPVQVRPGGRRLIEYVRGEPESLINTTRFESWPLIAEGTWAPAPDQGHEPGKRAARNASYQLRLSAGLLSFAWSEPWQVRTGPTSPHRLPAEIPSSWPDPTPYGMLDDFPEPHEEQLPTWMPAAWLRVASDPHARAALMSWHEAMLLLPDHPSFAYVAFVGAVEELSHCVEFSGAIGRSATSATRVAAMIGRYASVDQRASLDTWATLRGATAHGARLHGIEEAYGTPIVLDLIVERGRATFAADPQDRLQHFHLRALPAMRDLAATGLGAVLTEGGAP